MKRRVFLTGCVSGAAVAAGAVIPSRAAHGKAKPGKKIDVEKFVEQTHRHFIPGKRTCGESILMTGCQSLGIKSDLVPDIALGLGGGVGLQGETCGVLTGAAMVLSLAVAAKHADYADKMAHTMAAVGRVHRAFRKQFGHTDCRSLCGLDLTTPEGREKLAQGVKAGKCAKCVRSGARLLAKELQNL